MSDQRFAERVRSTNARLRRAPAQEPGAKPAPAVALRFDWLALSVVWGVGVGFVEVALLFARQAVFGASALGSLQLSDHFAWMIPCVDLAIFLILGAASQALGRAFPRLVASMYPRIMICLAGVMILLWIKGLAWYAIVAFSLGLSWRFGGALAAARVRIRRAWGYLAPAAIVVLVIVSAVTIRRVGRAEAWARRALPAPSCRLPNVLLVVLDTVRRDRLSMYGYERTTTPELDGLGARGVRFDSAWSPAPWTLPAHASMFTGRWPGELGVGDDAPLDATTPVIAEFLRDRGYDSAGIIGNTFYCNSWYGLNRGFVHYEDDCKDNHTITIYEIARSSAAVRRLAAALGSPLDPYHSHKDAGRIAGDLLAWLRSGRDRSRPFFAFLNLIDAHSPYLTPEGSQRVFGTGPESPEDFGRLMAWDRTPSAKIDKRIARIASDCYDDSLRHLDAELGKMFRKLDADGTLENTWVIITSDHGEEFGEHGLYGHGRSLYAEELRVPLVIVPPGGVERGRVVEDPVSTRNLPATIADFVDPAAPSPFPGRSLSRFWSARADRSIDPILFDVRVRAGASSDPRVAPALRGPMRAILLDGGMLIRNADRSEELYDFATDPGECVNLAARPAFTAQRQRLSKRLDELAGP